MDLDLVRASGMTEGEAKVYASLLKLGTTTTGPIIEKSGVANSIVYRILNNLIEKGLVSYIVKEKTRYYKASQPTRLLDYIDEQKEKLEQNKKLLQAIMPRLQMSMVPSQETSVQIFEGFRGFQTAWEYCYAVLKKGDEYYSWGIYPVQEQRFHLYWQRDHKKRARLGIIAKLLFNKGTELEILKNRNRYRGCDARYMPVDIKTPAWFVAYKNVTGIFLQRKTPIAIQILDQQISESFKAYFEEFWRRSKKM